MTCSLHQLTSRCCAVATLRCCWDSSSENFLDIKSKRNDKKRRDEERERGTRSKTKMTTQGDWRDRVFAVFHIFFLEILLIENKMIVIIRMMF